MSITLTEPPPTPDRLSANRLQNPRRPSLASFGPPHLIASALVLAAGVIALAPPSDPDVWWHVRTGDFILQRGRLPGVDSWSLVASGSDWIAHEWLGQVIIALFHKVFGLAGLSLYRAVGVTVLIGALAVQAFRRTTPYRALACTVLVFFATTGGWGERPQLISFILLIPVAQLIRASVAGRRSPWLLVPIVWLWANLHGLWLVTIALLGVAVLGLLLQRAWRANLDLAARLTSVAVVCLAAAALTPNGPRLLLSALEVREYAQFVSEWDAPSVHTAYGLAFFAMVMTFVVVYGRSHTALDSYTLVQVVFAILLGTLYIRTVAPAAVLLLPLLADALGRPQAAQSDRGRSPAAVNGLLLGIMTTGALIAAGATLTILPPLPPGAPVAATKALAALGPDPLPVLNEYGIGGWLIGRAPTVRPAIDGRTEIFSVQYVTDYLNALNMSGDWQSTIAPLGAQGALLKPSTPLVNGLRQVLGWQTVYSDENWVVLAPPDTPLSPAASR